MSKINLNAAIIHLEKYVMNISQGRGLMNVYGMTPTEIQVATDKYDEMLKPFEESIRILKNANQS